MIAISPMTLALKLSTAGRSIEMRVPGQGSYLATCELEVTPYKCAFEVRPTGLLIDRRTAAYGYETII